MRNRSLLFDGEESQSGNIYKNAGHIPWWFYNRDSALKEFNPTKTVCLQYVQCMFWNASPFIRIWKTANDAECGKAKPVSSKTIRFPMSGTKTFTPTLLPATNAYTYQYNSKYLKYELYSLHELYKPAGHVWKFIRWIVRFTENLRANNVFKTMWQAKFAGFDLYRFLVRKNVKALSIIIGLKTTAWWPSQLMHLFNKLLPAVFFLANDTVDKLLADEGDNPFILR